MTLVERTAALAMRPLRGWSSRYQRFHTVSKNFKRETKQRINAYSAPCLGGSRTRSSVFCNPHVFTRGGRVAGVRLSQHEFVRCFSLRAEETPNPNSMKFLPEVSFLKEGQTAEFTDVESAARSPLAERLLRNDAIRGVFIGPDFITVTKDDSYSWEQVKPVVCEEVTEFLSAGTPALLDHEYVSDTAILPEDSEAVCMIKELLETRIKPSIQEDGGDVVYKGFVDGVVFLKLQGSCSNCPSSSVTLKQGIERMMMHWIAEVVGVVAVESDEEYERLAEEVLVSGSEAVLNSQGGGFRDL